METLPDRARVPDVTVDCGSPDLSIRFADRPTVVVEVLSPSTRDFDRYDRHHEFRALAAVEHIGLIDAERVRAAVWTRAADGWRREEAFDLEGALALPAIGCELPMAELYEDAGLDG